MIAGFDHVVLIVRDLDAVIADYESLFARSPSWRSEADGAAQALFGLDNISLELLAPAGVGALGDRVRAALEQGGEGLASLALRTGDIAAAHRRARRLDLEPDDVAYGESRSAATGAVRAWKRFRLGAAKTHGVRVFVIEHDQAPAHSAALAQSSVTGVDHVVVQTPAPDRAAALYGARLGLDMALDRTNPDWGHRLMFFRCGEAILEVAHGLSSAGEGADTLWGITWRVAEADAAQARIAAAGFNVSPVRVGRKPGTRVFTVRDRTGGVPTLMLQPAPETT